MARWDIGVKLPHRPPQATSGDGAPAGLEDNLIVIPYNRADLLEEVFARHGDVYVKVRRVLVSMTVIVLLVFWALPTSPGVPV